MKLNRACVCSLLVIPTLAVAQLEDVSESSDYGDLLLNVRYRYEFVDQSNFDNNANAHSVRTRLGYRSPEYHGFFAEGNLEYTENLSSGFNSTANGNVDFPTIPDPDNTEVNEFFIGYRFAESTVIKVGRQAVDLDNQRFISSASWRQNQRTLDSITLDTALGHGVNFFYAYVENVNRIFGDDNTDPLLGDLDVNAHFLNASWDLQQYGSLTGYAYLIEDLDNPDLSQQTFGINYNFKHQIAENQSIGIDLSFADQSDYKQGNDAINNEYYFAEGHYQYGRITVRGGYEVLGGNGELGLATPLSTFHEFNGLADVFVNTPATGLTDIYGGIGIDFAGFNIDARYHSFNSDLGNVSFGDEFDFMVTKKVLKDRLTLGAKYANFNADNFAFDREFIAIWAEFSFN